MVWEKFFDAFLDQFFPRELREYKAMEFVNLKKGKRSVKDYVLNFIHMSCYALELVSNIRSCMRNLVFDLSNNLVLEYKGEMLNSNMDMSRLVVYI